VGEGSKPQNSRNFAVVYSIKSTFYYRYSRIIACHTRHCLYEFTQISTYVQSLEYNSTTNSRKQIDIHAINTHLPNYATWAECCSIYIQYVI